MTRREAILTAVASTAGVSAWASQPPYNMGGQASDFRIIDLATVRELIIRLPKGNITIQTEELWKALNTPAPK